jgi:hypothetical protein
MASTLSWKRLSFLHAIAAITLGLAGAVASSSAVFFGSLFIFAKLYPHDGMDGLASFMLSVAAFLIAGIGITLSVKYVMDRRAQGLP